MSANVETMFYVREKPWHGLGTMVQKAPTSAEALKLAGLDWTVEARDMWLNGGYEPIPGYKANVRSSDNKVLGVVSNKYRIVQNAEAFAFTDALIGGDVHYLPRPRPLAGCLDYHGPQNPQGGGDPLQWTLSSFRSSPCWPRRCPLWRSAAWTATGRTLHPPKAG